MGALDVGTRVFPDPMCARCHRVVSVSAQFHNDERNEIWFMAQCHGRTELVKIPIPVLEDAVRSGGIGFAYAFTDEAEPKAPPQLPEAK